MIKKYFHSLAIRLTPAVAATALLLGGAAYAKKPDITASVDRENIFVGESIRLAIKVSNYQNGQDPDLSQLKNCSVRTIGSQDSSFKSIIIVNGHRKASGFSGRTFTYELTPTKPGRFQIKPIIVDGTEFVGPSLYVKAIEKQDYAIFSIVPSKTNVIVDEPFSVSLRLLVKALPPPFSDASPLPPNNPPNIQAPFLNDDNFPGLVCPNIQELLQPRLVNSPRAPGVTINNFTAGISFFGDSSLACFDLNPTLTTYNAKPYFEYTLTLKYIPNSEGDYTFGPANFKGEIYVDATPSGQGITKRVYAIAPAQTVHVIPPPADDRPASYIGAIGTNLTVKAALDAQTCNVGDPLTLTITVSGDIQLENLYTPPIWNQSSLTDNFRIYRDSVRAKTIAETRRYTYTIRPTKAGTLELPALEFSYYNPTTKSYHTVKTDPIPVRANPATEFQDSTVIDTARHSVTIISTETDKDSLTPAPVVMGAPIAITTPIFIAKLHLPLFLAGPIIIILIFSLRGIRKLLPSLNSKHRRQAAAAAAIRRITNAGTPGETAAAMRAYIADRFDTDTQATTPDETRKLLIRHKVSATTAQEFAHILEHNFNASFQHSATADTGTRDSQQNACNIIKKVEKEL